MKIKVHYSGTDSPGVSKPSVNVNRRAFLKTGLGVIGAVAVAPVAFRQEAQAQGADDQDAPSPSLRYKSALGPGRVTSVEGRFATVLTADGPVQVDSIGFDSLALDDEVFVAAHPLHPRVMVAQPILIWEAATVANGRVLTEKSRKLSAKSSQRMYANGNRAVVAIINNEIVSTRDAK